MTEMTTQKSKPKRATEKFFATIIHLVIRFRLAAMLLVLILTIASMFQVKQLSINTSNEGFLHEDDPTLLTYYDFRDQFAGMIRLQLV